MENKEISVFTKDVVLTKKIRVITKYDKIEDHPLYEKLLLEFHPTKNGDLKLSDFSHGQDIKLWWKCYDTEFDDHEWIACISDRFLGSGCLCCVGQKVVLSNCLVTTHYELSKTWHPTKNGNLTPYDVTAGSRMEVWWFCNEADDHEWPARISSRVTGNGCSCCSKHKLVFSNCLASTHIWLVEQFHPTKNGNLTPYNLTSGSIEQITWTCDVAGDHEWTTTVAHRTISGSGCPCCSGNKVVLSNCLATVNPALCEQWDYIKNGDLTPFMVTAHSGKKVHWTCDKEDDHKWPAAISGRANGGGCPCCSGKKVVLSNCLATVNPVLAKQFHPTKNGSLTPFMVTAYSGKEVHWMCDKEDTHNWPATVSNRSNGGCCPICNKTRGEKYVANLLDKLFINYELYKKFDKCKHKRKLPFDFYLPDYNILIEYDGWQHSTIVEHWGGKEAFEIIKLRDAIKTAFAKDNNIPLLRIPYTEFKNIDNLVAEFIIKNTPINIQCTEITTPPKPQLLLCCST